MAAMRDKFLRDFVRRNRQRRECRLGTPFRASQSLGVSLRTLRGRTRERLSSAQKPRHFIERPLCRRQTDALRWSSAARGQPFDGDREMRTALGRNQRVNLVDDDRLDAGEGVAGVRRQHQVQGFRRGDQDVGRLALKSRPLGRRRVACSDGNRGNPVGIAACVGRLCDASERRLQVLLDVDRQRLERRDVHHAAPPAHVRRRREHGAIEAPEERRQCFSAPGRREDQRRLAAGDRRPAERLWTGCRREQPGKPLRDGRMK